MKIKILIPVYNDWQWVFKLLNEINNLSINRDFNISIIILHDASTFDRKEDDESFENIHSIKILDSKEIYNTENINSITVHDVFKLI